MLAYAASRPVVVDRRPHPNMMLMIIGAHVAVAALVMSAKMDLPKRIFHDPPTIVFFPRPVPPPPPSPPHPTRPQPGPTISHDPAPVPPLPNPTFPTNPTADPGPPPGPEPVPLPQPNPSPRPVGISSGVQLLTPASELKPPYPPSKLLNEEEAVLRLKLTIDGNGRVVAVDPVGRTDAIFLDAARRHLITHWRYKPAMEGGQPVASTMVITLRFQLDG